MKITKQQLQKIIKEEIRRLAEWGGEGTDHRSPASMLNQANDKLGEALNKMDGMRGAGEWTAQSELIDTHYDTLVGIYEQIKTIKDELAQAGRR
tara:strand:- start:471 stop:752 length:282 start_codon:yes stop_codon:yes gene_type:complete